MLDKMVDKITQNLTNKIRKEMPDVDDERAEVINYGLQILIGEVPKTFIMLAIAYVLGVFQLTLITFLIVAPYRVASGGFHLKTHLGCIISTSILYTGVAFLAKYIVLDEITKYILIGLSFIFEIIMIKLYAPADTENVPIISLKERKKKQIASYIILTIALIIAIFIPNKIISNIIIFGYFAQTCTITRFAYKLTKNRYGHEVYAKS